MPGVVLREIESLLRAAIEEGWSFLRQFARQRAHGAAFRSQDIGGGHADLTLAGKVQKFRLREIAKAFAESPRKASA